MRKVLICLIAVILCSFTTFSQYKVNRSNMTSCLSVTEAKSLVLNLRSFRQPDAFLFPTGTARYSDHNLQTVKRNYPVLYLFYQAGYVNLEDNGVHTFSTPTSKGEQLGRQFNGSIPFSITTLTSVDKVVCAKNKASINITISAKPTQTAVNLLGNSVYKVKPFIRSHNTKVDAKRLNGKWKIDEVNLISLD